jgi:hypothetical protein
VSRRYFDLNNTSKLQRRSPGASDSMQESDVKDSKRLLDIVKKLQRRVNELEANAQPNLIDFEVRHGTTATTVTLNHRFNSPVRYWMVGQRCSVSNILTIREDQTNTDLNKLVLVITPSSATAGRLIIRVEQSPYGQTSGVL